MLYRFEEGQYKTNHASYSQYLWAHHIIHISYEPSILQDHLCLLARDPEVDGRGGKGGMA